MRAGRRAQAANLRLWAGPPTLWARAPRPWVGRDARPQCLKALGFCLAATLATLSPLEAQQCTTDRPDPLAEAANDSLARRYARILEFAPGETHFPTVPFFPALDTIGRGAVGPWRVADSSRIAPLGRRGLVPWDSLAGAYALRAEPLMARGNAAYTVPAPRASAVPFRTRCLDARESSEL